MEEQEYRYKHFEIVVWSGIIIQYRWIFLLFPNAGRYDEMRLATEDEELLYKLHAT